MKRFEAFVTQRISFYKFVAQKFTNMRPPNQFILFLIVSTLAIFGKIKAQKAKLYTFIFIIFRFTIVSASEDEYCVTCNTTIDKGCEYNISPAMYQKCPKSDRRLGCFHLRVPDGNSTVRGCVSSLDGEVRKSCQSNSDECKICHGPNCSSRKDFPHCLSCKYEHEKEISANVTVLCPLPVTCKTYIDECFTHVKDNVVSRGCLGSATEIPYEDCENRELCERCSNESNCNDKEIKIEKCISCESAQDDDCDVNPNANMSTNCSLKVSKLGCFLEINENKNVKRGCMSSIIPEERQRPLNNSEMAKICIGENCNLKKSFQFSKMLYMRFE